LYIAPLLFRGSGIDPNVMEKNSCGVDMNGMILGPFDEDEKKAV
jgi:hypothetical protein